MRVISFVFVFLSFTVSACNTSSAELETKHVCDLFKAKFAEATEITTALDSGAVYEPNLHLSATAKIDYDLQKYGKGDDGYCYFYSTRKTEQGILLNEYLKIYFRRFSDKLITCDENQFCRREQDTVFSVFWAEVAKNPSSNLAKYWSFESEPENDEK